MRPCQHQGVVEGFVAKIVEEAEGIEERDNFVDSLKGGFKELEGIKIEIINKGDDQKVMINFNLNNQKKTLEINTELLKIIIKERNEFEKKTES